MAEVLFLSQKKNEYFVKILPKQIKNVLSHKTKIFKK